MGLLDKQASLHLLLVRIHCCSMLNAQCSMLVAIVYCISICTPSSNNSTNNFSLFPSLYTFARCHQLDLLANRAFEWVEPSGVCNEPIIIIEIISTFRGRPKSKQSATTFAVAANSHNDNNKLQRGAWI